MQREKGDPQMFHNKNPKIKPKGLLEFLKWKASSNQPRWPDLVLIDSYDKPPERLNGDGIRISFVGHVTFLIQTDGFNILTDPVWSERASPFSFMGPKRVTPPGIKFEDLPKIDLVLISHNHYDHMDIPTIKKLHRRDAPLFITPLKNDIVLKKHIPDIKIITLDWGDAHNGENGINICLEPAQHWSARGLFDKNFALWGTFIIKLKGGDICFIGDSGYDPELFKDIGKKHPKIALSLIPIGCFEPRWFMKDVHMSPAEALLTHFDLQSKFSIAMHFQTFQLADDAFSQAADQLQEEMKKQGLTQESFLIPEIGKSYLVGKIDKNEDHT